MIDMSKEHKNLQKNKFCCQEEEGKAEKSQIFVAPFRILFLVFPNAGHFERQNYLVLLF